MEGLRGEYPLELLLRVSGMSRSTYYHRLRSLRSGTGHQGTDALIAEIFHESGREYGCRKRYRRVRGGPGHAPNLLQQRFSASAPLEKLVTDVTEMRVLGGRRLYLSSIMDLHNNMVLAHSVSASNSWPMVREMLESLERRWGVTEGMMIHSDQGVLYRCGEYLKFARSHGIVRSMSGKGSCYDNAVIESHFGNLKGWLGKLDRIPADRAVEMIDSAVSHFNTKRILLKLGGLTPEEYLREYVREHKCGLKVAKIYNTL